MIYLIQILNLIGKHNINLFEKLFTNIEDDIIDLGYKNCESELVNDMLSTHFGIFMEDEKQLQFLTKIILDKKLNAGINAYKALYL